MNLCSLLPLLSAHQAVLADLDLPDGYHIIRPLGMGRASIVYEAQDLRRGGLVTIKVSAETSQEHEAQMLRRFGGTGVPVGIETISLDLLLRDGSNDTISLSCLVRQYLSGEVLLSLIGSQGALPLKQVLRYGQHLGTILMRIHEQQILVGDLHPGNLLIDEQDQLWLIDLGEACHDDRSATVQGVFQRALTYSAPELWPPHSRQTTAADIYAFGMILHTMLTGTFPAPCTCSQFPCTCGSAPLTPLAGPFGDLIAGMTNLQWEQRPTIQEVMDLFTLLALQELV